MPSFVNRHRYFQRAVAAGTWAITALVLVAALYFVFQGQAAEEDAHAGRSSVSDEPDPPWVYGNRPGSRFTITIYADLECPHCRSYFPVLISWIDRHPQAALQWHHLPLPFHEPAATELAITAECIGSAGGHAAFWEATAWIFQHTRGDGRGLPDNSAIPGITSAVETCIGSKRPMGIVQDQMRLAAEDGIDATPTLKIRDKATGKQLVLAGAVEDDALLSALDLLSDESASGHVPQHDLPADVVGKPR